MKATGPFLVVVAFAAACGSPSLMPTPVAFLDGAENPFEDVPEVFRTNEVDVLYVTDRRRTRDEDVVGYSYKRSASMAYGSCGVGIGEDVAWEELVEQSLAEDRTVDLPLHIVHTEEQGRFPETPLRLAPDGGRLVWNPEDLQAEAEVADHLREELRKRLALTPRKDAFVYVHGAHRAFYNSVYNTAEIWHYVGREGVPIAYSWPAGIGGLRGYFYDRESGEFTVYHLKQFLRILASVEELERIHIVAHSRGCDVVLSALREFVIEHRAAGVDNTDQMKLGNLVLAAPDLDLDVAMQRIASERLATEVDRMTIYMSLGDLAIGLSAWISHSKKRIGHATMDDAPQVLLDASQYITNMSFIDARVESDFIGHAYFLTHPAVSSDLLLLLRHGSDPGTENGRPLEHLGGLFWEIIGDDEPFDEDELELDEVEALEPVDP